MRWSWCKNKVWIFKVYPFSSLCARVCVLDVTFTNPAGGNGVGARDTPPYRHAPVPTHPCADTPLYRHTPAPTHPNPRAVDRSQGRYHERHRRRPAHPRGGGLRRPILFLRNSGPPYHCREHVASCNQHVDEFDQFLHPAPPPARQTDGETDVSGMGDSGPRPVSWGFASTHTHTHIPPLHRSSPCSSRAKSARRRARPSTASICCI
jgi:hypothetical protein